MCSHPWSGKRRRDKHCSIPMWTSSCCSPEVEGLLGLAQVVHLPIAGTFWEGSGSASCLGHRSSDPHPTEQFLTALKAPIHCGCGRHHGATRQEMLYLSAATGCEPRLFAVSCLGFIYYSYQARDKYVRQALISQRKHRKSHIIDEARENSLVIKLPGIISTYCG